MRRLNRYWFSTKIVRRAAPIARSHATWIPFYGVCHEVFERGGQGVYARRLAPRLGDTCGGCHDVVVLEAERTRDFFDAGGAGRLLG